MPVDNRRRHDRLGISLPVRVNGHDPSNLPWQEMAKCSDASEGGCSFVLQHAVFPGQVLMLQLALPKRFRAYDAMKTTYQTYALVQTAHLGVGGTRVGVAFLGRTPPVGYDRLPGGRFMPERRRARRGEIYLKVKLSKDGSDEKTVLENFGRGGARVMTAQPFGEGEVLTIEDSEGSFRAIAEVRSIYVGKDGIRRLNLKFR
ncbi:MAG TPA: PilZ domain-containing protein [Vicinamibacteria bacterium]|nr:PilZ domain-containing protein [Vicinamibacteria bacterium]